MATKTRIMATGEVKDRLTLEDYRALADRIDYPAAFRPLIRARLATDASQRFAVFGTALRLGLIKRVDEDGAPALRGRYVAWLKRAGLQTADAEEG